MADFEQHSWSITRGSWLTLSVVTFLLGIALGLAMRPAIPVPWGTVFASSPATRPKTDERFDLNQWKYPQAWMPLGAGGGEERVVDYNGVQHERFWPDLYAFSTTDPLEKVWAHYLKLAGINPEGNLFTSGTLAMDTAADLLTTAYVDETGGHPFRSATLVTHRKEYTVALFVSRVDKGTHIQLAVQQMPR
ncbi:MAG TPA: hypothetical protein VFG04_24240 [Planctomycetaceae bacterium]|jgi:hypothetical protein|nr:hypothetical protein [Planctomycetaceae bacterium]